MTTETIATTAECKFSEKIHVELRNLTLSQWQRFCEFLRQKVITPDEGRPTASFSARSEGDGYHYRGHFSRAAGMEIMKWCGKNSIELPEKN